jgi:hypothetical protein
MAQIDYLVSIQMNQNQLLYPVIHNLTSAPNTSPTPVEGQMYMNTTDDNLYVYAGGVWVDLTTSQGNLGYTASPTNGTVTSGTTGSNATLPLADGTNAGLLAPGAFTQLSNFFDGDKGDITVSASGATWTIDADAVTYAKIQNVSGNNVLLGNNSGGGSPVEELTASEVRTLLSVELNSNNYSHPNHTGHVTSTGDGATVVVVAAITGQTALTSGLASTDELLVNDGGSIKRMDISVLQTYMQSSLSLNTTLSGLTDTTITTPASGNILIYDGTDSWDNKVLSGDATIDNTGALTISDSAVTLAKQADVGTATVFYRKTGGTGAPEVQTLATLKTDLGLIGSNTGDQTITLTGDVTGSGTGSFITTIAANAIDWGMLNQSWIITQAEGIDANDNDNTIPTSAAVKDYVDSSVAGQLVYQGGYNASTNTPDLDVTTPATTVNIGFAYTVTAAGTFFSEDVQIGDLLIAEIDDPNVIGDWTVVNKNIPDIVNASETEKGIVEEATDAEVAAGTATGATGAKLFVTPAKLQTEIGTPGGAGSLVRRKTFTTDAATYTDCEHNLGNKYVQVEIYRSTTPWDKVEAQVDLTSATECKVSFNVATSAAEYTIIVIG